MEWAFQLSYVVDVLTVLLLIICVLQMAWTTLGYLKSSDSRFIQPHINRFLRSVFGITMLMFLTVLNRFAIITFFGSTDVYREWQIAHASNLSGFTWSIVMAVFGIYATILFVRSKKKEQKCEVEKSVGLHAEESLEDALQPEDEIEKVLAVIKERY